MKCPKCGAECVENAKFCEECGYAFPQQKECPKCHTMLKSTAKFCLECGYNFVAGKSNTSGGDSPKGMSIGDKNVIAGDVVGRKDAYNISGSATFVTNSDETKKMVRCHVCGRNILIGDSSNCPVCQEVTCADCLDHAENMCKKCVEEKSQGVEQQYIQVLERCYADGRISLNERQELDQKKRVLGISDRRAFELESAIKAQKNVASAQKAVAQPMAYEKTILRRAFDLFYVESKTDEAFDLVEPLHKKYAADEEVLALYLSILAKKDETAAQNFVDMSTVDVECVYLTAADLLIAHENWAEALEKLSAAEALWPGHFLTACRRIFCFAKMGKANGIDQFIDDAGAELMKLPSPTDLLEKSWFFLAQTALSVAMGDKTPAVNTQYCAEHHLSPLLLLPCILAEEQSLFERSHVSLPNGVSLEMVGCPAGSFTMGSPSNESGHYDNETQHRVTLTKPFLIGKYEVTQAQYEAVTGETPSKFKGSNCPVEQVSWVEAMAFCEKLNALTEGKRPAGYKFSLPTEAQWEYACRAGSTGAYAGDLDSMGWYDDNSGNRTHDVGQKQPNAWGIYDTHGNVWEWCRDWYGEYTGDETDPTGPSSGSFRVIRGGSWYCSASYCRSAFRFSYDPGYRFNFLGFRVALVPVQ